MAFSEKNGVKNTTEGIIFGLMGLISPPLCRGCGREGGLLCERCKNYIISHKQVRRMDESEELVEKMGREAIEKVRYLGYRDEILGELVEEYKYMQTRGLEKVLGEVVFESYFREELMLRGSRRKSGVRADGRGCGEILLVPSPTSKVHIRERGFDHMMRIAEEVRKRGRGRILVKQMLLRGEDTVQVGAGEARRWRQAKGAIKINPEFLGEDGKVLEELRGREVVVIDDVWTTGATMTVAMKLLEEAGMKKVRGLLITKNRQGKTPRISRGEF